jgi:hypothetical protein
MIFKIKSRQFLVCNPADLVNPVYFLRAASCVFVEEKGMKL